MKMFHKQTIQKMAKKKINSFGNFVLMHDVKKGVLSINAVSGFWSLSFRNDHIMYGILLKYGMEKSMEPYFEHLFSLWYMLSQGLPDGKCLEDLVTACDAWYRRLSAADKASEIDKEADDAIVREIAKSDEIGEEAMDNG